MKRVECRVQNGTTGAGKRVVSAFQKNRVHAAAAVAIVVINDNYIIVNFEQQNFPIRVRAMRLTDAAAQCFALFHIRFGGGFFLF